MITKLKTLALCLALVPALLPPLAQAAVTQYAVRMTATDTSGYGTPFYIDPTNISVGDSYLLRFLLDDSAINDGTPADPDFYSALSSLQILRDPGNTGTYVPAWTPDFASFDLGGNETVTYIAMTFVLDDGNSVTYTDGEESGPAAIYQAGMHFAIGQAFDPNLPAGSTLAAYLATYPALTSWTPQAAVLNFSGEETVDAYADGANVSIEVVPEPSTYALLALGVGLFFLVARRSLRRTV